MTTNDGRGVQLGGDAVIGLVSALGAVIATAEHSDELIARTLDVLAEATGWPQAEAWIADGGLLVRAPGTVALTPQAGAFNDVWRHHRFERGEGLPGRAWEVSGAIVLPSLADVPWCSRAGIAMALGFTAAAAVPVIGPGGLEFVVVLHGSGTVDAARLGLLLSVAASQLRGIRTRLAATGPQVTTTDVRLGAITAGARVAVWEWRPGDEHILAGPAIRELFGLRPTDPIPSLPEYFAMVVPEDRHAVREAIRTILETPGARVPFSYEYRLRTPGGEIRWLFVQGALHRSPTGGGALLRAATQDITHLRLGEQRLAGALRAAGMAWWELDPASDAIVPSPDLARMLGLPPGATLATLGDLLAPVRADDRTSAERTFRGLTEDGTACTSFRVPHAGGGDRWLEATATHTVPVTGGPARITGVVRDVTVVARSAMLLRESEEHHRALFERHPLPVLLVDAESDLLLDVNPSACALYGLERSRLGGVTAHALVVAADRVAPDAEGRGGDAAARGTQQQQQRHRTADGRVIDVLVTSEPVTHRGRPARLSVVTDITARLVMERRLAETAQRFRSVIDHIEDGVLLLDMDGSVMIWNPAAERILGLAGDVLRGFRPADPRWGARDEQGTPIPTASLPVQRACRERRAVTQTIQVTRGDGPRIWIRVHAVPVISGEEGPHSVVATFTDVTESRAAAHALAEGEARYRLLAEQSRDLVCRHAPDGTFTYVSPSVTAILGWTPEELVGKDVYAYVHPDDTARMRALAHAPVRAGEAVVPPVTYRARKHDGTYTWLETQVAPVLDAGGRVTAIVAGSRDVSERRALEAQLRHAARTEAIGTLAGGIAHDVATVLSMIRDSAAALAESVAMHDEAARTELEAIEGATARGQALTRQLLAVARRDADPPVPVVLDDALRRAVPLLRRLLRSDQRLALECAAPAVTVTVDVAELELSLMNLVSNARAAMPDGGEVTIASSVLTLDAVGARAAPPLRPGPWYRITVRDTGAGMSEAVRARLFEPSFTTRPVGEGAGQGLPTVYGAVRRAGGAITVTSAPGAGTTFTIWLPVAVAASGAGPVPAGPAARPAPSAGRVVALVVDGDERMRAQTARTLRRDGIGVIEAASGEAALAVLQGGGAGVSLLLTDFQLPDMSGRELVEYAAAHWPPLRTLLVSAHVHDDLTRQALQRTRTRFLAKPYTRGEFLRTVREAVRGPCPVPPDEVGQGGT